MPKRRSFLGVGYSRYAEKSFRDILLFSRLEDKEVFNSSISSS